MKRRGRILVVDDSVVMRKLLGELIANEPELVLAGTAPTMSVGIAKIEHTTPDVVILDVGSEDAANAEAIARIRKTWPKLPIVMCSTAGGPGTAATRRAFSLGATDYITKPSSTLTAEEATTCFRDQLLPKLKALAFANDPDEARVATSLAPGRIAPAVVEAVVIGSSTGGPNALATLFASLPADLPVPILIVQHMPPVFTRLLAERISASSLVRTHEAKLGQPIEPGQAYIAPGNFHMTVQRDAGRVVTMLNQGPSENSCRPAVDVLFRSAARVWGPSVLGVVLTGMGRDGAAGSEHIVSMGGAVIVQDDASCVVPSMPRSVFAAGLADAVVSLDRIGTDVVTRVRRGRVTKTPLPLASGEGRSR